MAEQAQSQVNERISQLYFQRVATREMQDITQIEVLKAEIVVLRQTIKELEAKKKESKES